MANGDKNRVLTQSDINVPGGVAPAGFGLGQKTPEYVDNWDNAAKAGFYYGKVNSPTGDWCHGIVIPRTEGYFTQRVWSFTAPNITFYAERSCYDGVFSPWEWSNPPMVEGEEYRTTERYKGKPVYVKLLNMGAMPAKTTTSPEHHIPNIAECVRAHHVMAATKNDGRFVLPFMTNSLTVTASFSITNVVIYDSGEHADHVCMSTLYYTKTTDN